MGYVSQTLAVVILLKIFGTARKAVGSDHLEGGVAAEEGVVVVRDILIRKLVVQQFGVQYATLRYEMAHADIVITRQIVDVLHAGTSRLVAHIRQTVARTCRNSHYMFEVKVVFHKTVEHATCENSSHATALEHQSCITVNSHNVPFVDVFRLQK